MVGDGSILFSGVQKFPRLVETSRNVAQSDWTYSKLWLSSLLSLLLWLFNQRRRISPTNTPYRNNIWMNYGDVLRYTGPNSSNFECESGAHLGFAGGENQTSPPLMLTSNVAWHIPWYPYPSLKARSWNNVPQNLPSENRLAVVCRGSSSFLFNPEIPKMFFFSDKCRYFTSSYIFLRIFVRFLGSYLKTPVNYFGLCLWSATDVRLTIEDWPTLRHTMHRNIRVYCRCI